MSLPANPTSLPSRCGSPRSVPHRQKRSNRSEDKVKGTPLRHRPSLAAHWYSRHDGPQEAHQD
jgi:hypothetical protein